MKTNFLFIYKEHQINDAALLRLFHFVYTNSFRDAVILGVWLWNWMIHFKILRIYFEWSVHLRAYYGTDRWKFQHCYFLFCGLNKNIVGRPATATVMFFRFSMLAKV